MKRVLGSNAKFHGKSFPSDSSPFNEWADILISRIDRVSCIPTRSAVHNLRRSCRIGQAFLDIPIFAAQRSCRSLARNLSRTLRLSRDLRNYDVLKKFLMKERIRLLYKISRQKEGKKLQKCLIKRWSSKKFSKIRKCLRFDGATLHSMKEDPESSIGVQLKRVLSELKKAYWQFSSGKDQDFSHVHDLRINLKKISGKDSIFGGCPALGTPLKMNEKRDLEFILRHLGKMSDLLMMEAMGSELEGKRSEHRRFLKKIKKNRFQTDRIITRFLQKISTDHPLIPIIDGKSSDNEVTHSLPPQSSGPET